MLCAELTDALYHPGVLLRCHTGVDANPEAIVHDEVGILQLTNHTIALACAAHLVECRVFDKVACEEVSGLNLVLLEI
jgi:hypothetical protein